MANASIKSAFERMWQHTTAAIDKHKPDWNSLENKPVVMQGGDTLTWDGNTEGLVSVADSAYKISDRILTYEDVKNGIIDNRIGETISVDESDFSSDGFGMIFIPTDMRNDDGVLILNTIAIIPTDNYLLSEIGITFPCAGLYVNYPISLTIPNYTGFAQEKIAPSHLYQSDFSQNNSSAPDYIKNRTHWAEEPVTTTEVILEETTFEFSEGAGQAENTFLNLLNDTEYVVTWDGIEYTVSTYEAMGFTVFGNPILLGIDENPEDNGMPFAGAYSSAEVVVIFMTNNTEATEHTIGITKTTITQEIHKIDDKYINAAWMAQKTVVSTVVLPETTATLNPDGITLECDIDTLMSAEYIDVLFNGDTYRCTFKSLSVYKFLGNVKIFDPTFQDSGEPFLFVVLGNMFIAVAPEEITATFSIIVYNSHPISTIPEEYLPEKLQFGNEYEAEIIKDVITWDGDTTGREVFNGFYFVSNAIPTFEELSNGGIITDDDGAKIIFSSNEVINSENLAFIVMNVIFILTEDAASLYGLPAGIYFIKRNNQYVSSFTINNCSFVETETKIKTIDPKYLPEGIGGGSGSALPEVDADDEGAFLRVVDGEWVVTKIPYVEDGEF